MDELQQTRIKTNDGVVSSRNYCLLHIPPRTPPGVQSDEPDVAEAAAAGVRERVVGAQRVKQLHAQRPPPRCSGTSREFEMQVSKPVFHCRRRKG